MLNRIIHAICYTHHTPETQPKWARDAIRIERPEEFDGDWKLRQVASTK